MGSCVFWIFVTFSLFCILCGNAFGESTIAKVFASLDDDVSETNTKSMFQMKKIRSIKTNSDEITLKDDPFKSEILQSSPNFVKSVSKTETLSNPKTARCSRYCIQKLETEEEMDNSFFKDICISWFARENEENEGKERERVGYFLENNAKIDASRQIPINIYSNPITFLSNCQVDLDSSYNIIDKNIGKNSINQFDSNLYFNRQNIEIFQDSFSSGVSNSSKKLLHRTKLNGNTESDFHIDPNVTKIILNISGNVTRAILVIPITGRTMRRLGIIMSLASPRTKGVVSGARTLPSGEWRVKLTGAENSTYDLDVAVSFETNEENKEENVDIKPTSESNVFSYDKEKDSDRIIKRNVDKTINKTGQVFFNKLGKENIPNDQLGSMFLINSRVKNNGIKSMFERSIKMDPSRNDKEREMTYNFSDSSSNEFAVEKNNVTNYPTLHNRSLTSYDDFRNPQNKEIFNDKIFATTQQQKIQARMSEVASLNEDIDIDTKSFAIENVSTRTSNNDHIQELSSDFAKTSNEDILGRRKTLIEVNANSNLIAAAGTTHRVMFDVSNNCLLLVRYAIRARSTPFRIYNIQPPYLWLYPGQTSHVAVDIFIPLGSQDTVNTLTLSLGGTEISEKTVYIYIQNAFSKLSDDIRPSIEYSFNSNCAGTTDRYRCDKTFWSADITVHDPDSGLKRVISTPNDISPRTTFISGTKEHVKFYYSSTCCSTTAKITAIDVSNNQYTRTLDVTAWDNLSQGEIAAITLGALLLLFLLILLILAIVYCIRKRESRDLPYTQRYGSRPPARSERTSF